MSRPPMDSPRIAVFCVGSPLMLDDGLGPAVYEQIIAGYELPETVDIFDVGCLSLDMIDRVSAYDRIITVDAIDGTDEPPGTVFEFTPADMARRGHALSSLHELKLIDLFDAASLLGYQCEGKCFGIQVSNRSPETITIGLTQPVFDAVPLLIDAVLADLTTRGATVVSKRDGKPVEAGYHHRWIEAEDRGAEGGA